MKSYRRFLVVMALLFVIYIILQLTKPDPTDWAVTLSKSDKMPFGSYILYDQLQNLYPSASLNSYREPLYNSLPEEDRGTSAYFIIAPEVAMEEMDIERLLRFAEKGNYVFISGYGISDKLLDTLGLKTAAVFDVGPLDSNAVRLSNPTLKDTQLYTIDKLSVGQYFSEVNNRDSTTVLGVNNRNHPDFVKVTVGDGAFFVHAAPLCFTNYFLLYKNNKDYTEKVLSYIPKHVTNVFWDEYYKLGRGGASTPLRFFLNNTWLRYALWLSIIALLLFVLFNMKRKQRIIPVIAPLRNTTLDFVKTVSGVYFNQKDNAGIAHKKIVYWLEFVRQHFYLSTQQLDNEFIQALEKKSGVNETLIRQIVQYAENIQEITVNDALLREISDAIDTFYKQAS